MLAEPSTKLFEVLALNPLTAAQRDEYLRKWCAVRGIHGKDGRSLRTSFREKTKEPTKESTEPWADPITEPGTQMGGHTAERPATHLHLDSQALMADGSPKGAAMSGIFAAKSDGYADVPLLGGEQIVRTQTASVDGKSIWGGQLVITNQRILFRPLDVKGATKLLNDGIEFLPDQLAVLGKVVSKALDYAGAYGDNLAGAVPRAEIASVATGKGAALFHPPSLLLALGSGQKVELGILYGRLSPNLDPRNSRARDEIVTLIRALIEVDS